MRYILDIANTTEAPANYAKEFMEEICETMADHIITIVCIDETNANQFHDDPTKNTLTDAQLQRYTDYCHSDRPNQQTNKPNKIIMNQTIEANNKCLSFKGTAKQALDFVEMMRDRGTYTGFDFDNELNDFVFNIERDLQDAGIYDEHFNKITPTHMKVKLMTQGWGDNDLPIDADNQTLPSMIHGIPLRDVVFNASQPDALDNSTFNLFIWIEDRGWLVQSADFDFVTT